MESSNGGKRSTEAAVPSSHRAYSVIRREGQDDYWLNIGLMFPHKDDAGFNIMLQAFPLDGKIVCRAITAEDEAEEAAPSRRPRENASRAAPASRR